MTLTESNDNKNEIDFNSIYSQLKQLNDCLDVFSDRNQLLIEKCEQLLAKVNKHKNDCNIAKSVGTGVGGAGSVALISGVVLLPFTAGLSSLLSIGGGVATGVGAVATIATDFADSLLTKKFFRDLRQLAEERNGSAIVLSRKLSAFDYELAVESSHLKDDPTADQLGFGFKCFKLMATGSVKSYQMGSQSIKLFDAIKEFKALKAVKSIETNASFAKDVTKSAFALVPTEAKGVSAAAVRTTSVSTSKLVLRGASAGVGLVFTVIDVVDLVKHWNTTHPTVDAINDLIEKLRKDSKLIQSIRPISDELINDILGLIQSNSPSDPSDSVDDNEIIVDFDNTSVLYNRCAVNES